MTLYDVINSLYSLYICKIVLRSKCGKNCKFYFPVSIYDPKNLMLGDRVKIGPFVTIICGTNIRIMSDSLIASNTVITTSGHYLNPKDRNLTKSEPINIGKNVWIGASSTLLPGCTIGENSVVAAGSIVSKDVPSNTCLIQKKLSTYSNLLLR